MNGEKGNEVAKCAQMSNYIQTYYRNTLKGQIIKLANGKNNNTLLNIQYETHMHFYSVDLQLLSPTIAEKYVLKHRH